jgi:hypothetical protein
MLTFDESSLAAAFEENHENVKGQDGGTFHWQVKKGGIFWGNSRGSDGC